MNRELRIKNKECKTVKTIILFLLFIIGYLLFAKTNASARIRYPIHELGSCRNQRECYLYCQIPANTPTCWSYGRYVLNQNVLGEETVDIKYPITELGNCKDAESCFDFCKKEKNQTTCTEYGKKKGLIKQKYSELSSKQAKAAKEALGCDSKQTCMPVCSKEENFQKCQEFADKYGLESSKNAKNTNTISSKVLAQAKKELGCKSVSSCISLCAVSENQEKCDSFAKANELVSKERIEKEKEYSEKQEILLNLATKELNCTSLEACSEFCSKPENVDVCNALKNKVHQAITSVSTNTNKETGSDSQKTITSVKDCASEKECEDYCQKHPDECEGYFKKSLEKKAIEAVTSSKTAESVVSEKGDFLGPTGCKTESECRAYCEKHPDECPNFPEVSTQPYMLPTKTTPTPKAEK